MNRKSELFLIVPHSGGVKLSPEEMAALDAALSPEKVSGPRLRAPGYSAG